MDSFNDEDLWIEKHDASKRSQKPNTLLHTLTSSEISSEYEATFINDSNTSSSIGTASSAVEEYEGSCISSVLGNFQASKFCISLIVSFYI